MQKIKFDEKDKIGDRYYLGKHIATGVHAAVFKAYDLNENEFAIKKIYIANSNEKFDEYMIGSKINHPNIVRYDDFLKIDDYYYILMELCNETLHDQLAKNKKLKEEEALSILIQILKGYYQLKKHQIIHRDLKPSNILVKDNIYKIADFGTAKNSSNILESRHGTAHYMSPQIKIQQNYTSKTDVWSIGIMYFEMLVGKWPIKWNSTCFPVDIEISKDSKDFIKMATMEEEKDRMGWEDVFQHPLFKKTDWEKEINHLKQTARNFTSTLMKKVKENDVNMSSFFKNLKSTNDQLNFHNFQKFIKSADLKLDQEQIHFIFREVDENKDGMIDQIEFIKWLDLPSFYRDKLIDESFLTLDEMLNQNYSNKEKEIDLEEFKNLPLIKNFLKEINEDQLQIVFESIDLDKSGKISFSEFKEWLNLSNYFRDIINKDLFVKKYNYQTLFSCLDKNKIGKIDKYQFKGLIEKIKSNMRDNHIDFIFSLITKDDKYISKKEFILWLDLSNFLRELLNKKIDKNLDLIDFFNQIDKDSNGVLNMEEFKEFILSIDKGLEDLSNIIFESINENKNGGIDFREFTFWLANKRTPKQAFSRLVFSIENQNKSLFGFFKKFGKNEKTLNKDEFRKMCNEIFKEKLTYIEFDALFLQFERNENGEITFDHFKQKIEKKNK